MCLSRLREGRLIRVQKRTINEEGAHMCLSRLREGRLIRVQKRTINEEGAHMCLSRLREGRWTRVCSDICVQVEGGTREAFTCSCPGWGKDDG
jgi:hypothetical protein